MKKPIYQLPVPPVQTVIRHLGLTQAQAAKYLGVATSTVNAWAAGYRQVPSEMWLKLAKLQAEMSAAAKAALEDARQKSAELDKLGIKAAEIDIDLPARTGGAAWPSADCAETIRAAVYLDYINAKEEIKK